MVDKRVGIVSVDLVALIEPSGSTVPTNTKEAREFQRSSTRSIHEGVQRIRALNQERQAGDRIVEFSTSPSGRTVRRVYRSR